MTLLETQLSIWSRAPSETEDAKCTNAASQITSALRSRFGNDIYIVRQGSHRNRTNIRVDSDIDLAVVHSGYYFSDTTGLTPADKALHEAAKVPADYPFADFKRDVHATMIQTFGAGSVDRKNKCIRVEGNTNRVNADVVPAYEHKRYRSFNQVACEGIEFRADNGAAISSYPDQHYENGVAKNDRTGRAYKSVVRILKHVRNKLVQEGRLAEDSISSYFLECLVWNVPDSYFTASTWKEAASSIALEVWSAMRDPSKANDYAEVSDLRWLFRGQTHRTPQQAEDFMLMAWSDLKD